MRMSFALCEALGLTPFPSPLDPERTRGALRREAPADTAVSGGEALRSLHCAARSAVQVSLRAAARRDHQPQLVYELMTRDTSRVMKKRLARRREPFLSGTKAFSLRSQGKIPSARSSRTALAGVAASCGETPAG